MLHWCGRQCSRWTPGGVDVRRKELKFSGLIGHAISAGKKSACVGETEIGISQTQPGESTPSHLGHLLPFTSRSSLLRASHSAPLVFIEHDSDLIFALSITRTLRGPG
ncbi:hypothetical protein BDR07DRAFT_912211 [Suillus spraguei]|nr:hypothetical protein BDR07DRAFT_912211 [Suillus spraguei]